MTVIAATTPTSNQVVVIPLPEFRLGAEEPLPVGLKRLTMTEMSRAVSGYFEGEETFSYAVHESRKSTKRVRAVLRLIRFEIGEQIFRYEDHWMRDTARMVAPLREAYALVETFDVLDRIFGHLLVDGVLDEVRDRLTVRRDRLEARVMEDPELVSKVVANFEKAFGRYSNWPTDPTSRNVYGTGVRDEFAAIAPGFHKTYEEGRAQMVGAYSAFTTHRFHEWRKTVKYLRHQMELMTPLWPEVVVGMAITFERIGELLGQDHDLALLLATLDDDAKICADPVRRSLIRALANQRRSDLQTAARVLGRRVFAEEPQSLTGRLDVYWETRQPFDRAVLDAGSIL